MEPASSTGVEPANKRTDSRDDSADDWPCPEKERPQKVGRNRFPYPPFLQQFPGPTRKKTSDTASEASVGVFLDFTPVCVCVCVCV